MLTKEQKKKLHELYSKGKYGHHEIAKMVGVDYRQAYAFFKERRNTKYYVRPPRSPYTKWRKSYIMDNVAEAYALYLGGMTLAQIGKRFGGVSRERVRQVFKMNRLKTRSAGFARRKTAWVCEKGHKLGKKEYPKTCKKCIAERSKLRKKGLHLVTHCKYGHVLAGHNLIEFTDPNGWAGRRCRACAYAAMRKSIAKKKQRL